MHTAGIGGTREHFVFIVNPSKAHRMKDVSVRFLKRSYIVVLAIDVAWCSLLSGGGVGSVCHIEYIGMESRHVKQESETDDHISYLINNVSY